MISFQWLLEPLCDPSPSVGPVTAQSAVALRHLALWGAATTRRLSASAKGTDTDNKFSSEINWV